MPRTSVSQLGNIDGDCSCVRWQLYLPLSWLGTIYRMVEDSFVDAEKMMHLLEIGPEVRDKPGASAGPTPKTCRRIPKKNETPGPTESRVSPLKTPRSSTEV